MLLGMVVAEDYSWVLAFLEMIISFSVSKTKKVTGISFIGLVMCNIYYNGTIYGVQYH